MSRSASKKWWLAPLVLLFGAGCGPQAGRGAVKQRVLMQSGFEQSGSRPTNLGPALATEKAHSGQYAVRVTAEHPRATAFRAELGKLSPHHRPRRLSLSAWVWVPSPQDDAALVLSIANPSDSLSVWQQRLYLTDSGPFKQWKLVSQDVDLPPDFSSQSQLTISLTGTAGEGPVYTDDLRLTELW